ncbi:MAG: hypothetical protein HC857_00080 [Synechococcales cyanobacterium RU_4_20]|nr:hypothetical protein [Synechococcales cyanobacterium RU_4_20]
MRNQLLVTEYSAGDDILALKLGANGGVIGSTQIASGLNNPLDLVEHRPTGNLYVSEFGANQISLLSVV